MSKYRHAPKKRSLTRAEALAVHRSRRQGRSRPQPCSTGSWDCRRSVVLRPPVPPERCSSSPADPVYSPRALSTTSPRSESAGISKMGIKRG